MKTSIYAAVALMGAALFSGCAGTGPNTQQGAVTGGVLGAVAGAIIGNNSRGGDSVGGALIGGAIGALAGGAIGNNVDHENGTIYSEGSRTEYSGERYAYGYPQPPPLPQVVEVVSAPPAPNALWVPGYWNFDGDRYFWVAAHWEIPPTSARSYVVAHWETRQHGYAFVPSYWR